MEVLAETVQACPFIVLQIENWALVGSEDVFHDCGKNTKVPVSMESLTATFEKQQLLGNFKNKKITINIHPHEGSIEFYVCLRKYYSAYKFELVQVQTGDITLWAMAHEKVAFLPKIELKEEEQPSPAPYSSPSYLSQLCKMASSKSPVRSTRWRVSSRAKNRSVSTSQPRKRVCW